MIIFALLWLCIGMLIGLIVGRVIRAGEVDQETDAP